MTYKSLTIAGSDSGGGAGIQADLKTFQELEVYGMSVITAVTAQNTLGVQAVYPMTVEAVEEQLHSIAADLQPDSVKTGMLYSAEIIEKVAEFVEKNAWIRLIVDPVMIAKGGASLLQDDAIHAVKTKLIPLAYVITPNIPEAEVLTEMKIETTEERKLAAKKLYAMGAANVVIKGGHSNDQDVVLDLLYDGEQFFEYKSPRKKTNNTHGTGCTFAAVLTAEIAKGRSLDDAVRMAKKFITAAIDEHLEIGSGHGPTNHWAFRMAGLSIR